MEALNSTSYDNSHFIEGEKIVGTIFMVILTLTSVAGNMFVLTTIFRSPQLRCSLSNAFVIDLCFIDLLNSTLVMPMSTAAFFVSRWPFGDKLCIVHAVTNSLLSFSTILCLCIVSVERFLSIRKPMVYTVYVTPCRVYFVIAFLWCYSSFFAGIPLMGILSTKPLKITSVCTFTWTDKPEMDTYHIVVFLFCYLIPGLCLTVMYVGIFRVARKTRLRIHPQPAPQSTTQSTTLEKFVDPPSVNILSSNGTILQTENSRRRARNQFKAVKTLILLVGVFLFSWGPYFTFNLYGAIHNTIHMERLEVALLWLGYSSSVFNPFLYGWRNRAIHEELTKLLNSARRCFSKELSEVEDADFMGSKEDFLQFLERTTCSTRLTTQSSFVKRDNRISSQHCEQYL